MPEALSGIVTNAGACPRSRIAAMRLPGWRGNPYETAHGVLCGVGSFARGTRLLINGCKNILLFRKEARRMTRLCQSAVSFACSRSLRGALAPEQSTNRKHSANLWTPATAKAASRSRVECCSELTVAGIGRHGPLLRQAKLATRTRVRRARARLPWLRAGRRQRRNRGLPGDPGEARRRGWLQAPPWTSHPE